MKKIRKAWLSLLFGSENERIREGQRIVADNVRRWFTDCPICEGDFAGHQMAGFAVTADTPEKKDRGELLLQTLRDHRWVDALAIKEFEPATDALVAYVLRCAGREFAVIVTREPYEPMFDAPSVVGYEILDQKSGDDLAALIEPHLWFSLSS